MAGGQKRHRLCIFLHSGSYDRFFQALSITNVVLATGGEVHIFCSYGALKRLVKGRTDDIVVEGELSPFKDEIEKNLKRGTLDTPTELLGTAGALGHLKVYACSASMAVLNISRDELIDDVEASMGLVSFLELVKGADQTLYI